MFITVENVRKNYPNSLEDFPTLEPVVKLAQQHFPVVNVRIKTGEHFPGDIRADIEFHYGDINFWETRLDGINVRIGIYEFRSPKPHYTLSPVFKKGFPFRNYFDVESTGEDVNNVFYSLLNGISRDIDELCKSILRGNELTTKKVSLDRRQCIENYHHREYC